MSVKAEAPPDLPRTRLFWWLFGFGALLMGPGLFLGMFLANFVRKDLKMIIIAAPLVSSAILWMLALYVHWRNFQRHFTAGAYTAARNLSLKFSSAFSEHLRPDFAPPDDFYDDRRHELRDVLFGSFEGYQAIGFTLWPDDSENGPAGYWVTIFSMPHITHAEFEWKERPWSKTKIVLTKLRFQKEPQGAKEDFECRYQISDGLGNRLLATIDESLLRKVIEESICSVRLAGGRLVLIKRLNYSGFRSISKDVSYQIEQLFKLGHLLAELDVLPVS